MSFICNSKAVLKAFDGIFKSYDIGIGKLYMEKSWNSKTVYW